VENTHQLGFVEMTNDAYHADEGISKSHLDVVARKSPKHYWEKYINPNHEPEQKTVPMQVGSAFHIAVLEPETLEQRVVIGLGHDRRSDAHRKAWDEYELQNVGRIILGVDNFDHVRRIRDAVWSHPVAPGFLTGGVAEQSVFAMKPVPDGKGGFLLDDEGKVISELVKCQIDYLRKDWDYIVDLKSTGDASKEAFRRSFDTYRYPVQTAWYQDVLDAQFGSHPENWVFLCVEKEPPYAIGIYPPSEISVARGRLAAERDYCRIVECRRANHWPDYGETIQELDLPPWSKL
jgi:exodeoxyribonuclease VIII